ncbi:MAG: prepilin-type N-terminal cleavage/methylation domain-containing protein [Bacilli bacterium]|nr:prepilin-type N-terminal cleavage/methylation domain-containing protein [Bacilli bacterium]
MKKKGFTLIELLAVIVILAIIAVITMPMIMNVIEKAKLGALEDSAYGLIEAANLYYTKNISEGINENISFIPDETKKGMYAGETKLSYRGSLPETGSEVLLKTDGTVGIKIIIGNYCAVKTTTETKVTILDNDCVTTLDGNIIEEIVSNQITELQTLIGSNDISTIGDGTITGAINNLSSSVNNITIFSNDEKIVGKWTDGKTIYQKTIYTTVQGAINYDLSAMNQIWLDSNNSFMYGYNNGGAAYEFIPLPYASTAGGTYSATVTFAKNNNKIFLDAGSAWTFNYAYITLRYTKSS